MGYSCPCSGKDDNSRHGNNESDDDDDDEWDTQEYDNQAIPAIPDAACQNGCLDGIFSFKQSAYENMIAPVIDEKTFMYNLQSESEHQVVIYLSF